MNDRLVIAGQQACGGRRWSLPTTVRRSGWWWQNSGQRAECHVPRTELYFFSVQTQCFGRRIIVHAQLLIARQLIPEQEHGTIIGVVVFDARRR